MELDQKIKRLRTLSSEQILRVELFYDILKECGDLKANYGDYSSTHPIDCNKELQRLADADYDLCTALITMLLREDHFSNGAFEKRQRCGQVKPIIDRMLLLLESKKTHRRPDNEKDSFG